MERWVIPQMLTRFCIFYQTIMPLVKRRIPGGELIVVGHEPTSQIHKLAEKKNVFVTGYVPDVIPYYQQSRVTIVPLMGGGEPG